MPDWIFEKKKILKKKFFFGYFFFCGPSPPRGCLKFESYNKFMLLDHLPEFRIQVSLQKLSTAIFATIFQRVQLLLIKVSQILFLNTFLL